MAKAIRRTARLQTRAPSPLQVGGIYRVFSAGTASVLPHPTAAGLLCCCLPACLLLLNSLSFSSSQRRWWCGAIVKVRLDELDGDVQCTNRVINHGWAKKDRGEVNTDKFPGGHSLLKE